MNEDKSVSRKTNNQDNGSSNFLTQDGSPWLTKGENQNQPWTPALKPLYYNVSPAASDLTRNSAFPSTFQI